MRVRPWIVLALAAALGLSGCGLALRPSTTPAPSTTAVTPRAAATPAAATNTPASAVRRFANAYINWTARDVAARLDTLARASVGQARSELELEAAETRTDTALHGGGIGNAGTVEAVSSLGARTYVVVTRELTTGHDYDGLTPAWHVSLATVALARLASGPPGAEVWVVSDWQPES